jgi:SAM-dependent methyltransferase
MLFTRAGLEQASSEPVARHRAQRFSGRVLDLCCGIGGDLLALGARADVTGVDRDPVHAAMARHNAGVYDVAAEVLVADVREVAVASYDAVFVDPARRAGDRRGGSEPPLEWCLQLPGRVAVKAAPGIDLATVPGGWEVEFVADRRDLKEAVLWSPALAAVPRRATVLDADAVHELVEVEGSAVAVREPGPWLLDPNPAVTRAGLVETLARQVGGWKVDDRIAFVCTESRATTPFARTLRVEDSLPWSLKSVARLVHDGGIGTLDIRRRGLAGDVEDIRKRLRPRGPRRATLVLTRVRDRPWALLCTDPGTSTGPGVGGT